MSFTKEVTIWCDSCSNWQQESGLTVADLRRKLRHSGWKNDGARDVCPKCQSKTESGPFGTLIP